MAIKWPGHCFADGEEPCTSPGKQPAQEEEMFLHKQFQHIHFPARDQQSINKTVSEGIVMTHFVFVFAACVCLQQISVILQQRFCLLLSWKKNLKMPIFPFDSSMCKFNFCLRSLKIISLK